MSARLSSIIGSPPVGEREVLMVSLVVLVQLPDAGESRAVVAELCAAALSEPRGVAFQRQLPAVEPDRVDPMDAARVEVLHREVVLALHHLLPQPVAPRHLQLAVELLLQLAHLGRRVAAVEDRRVVPLWVLERCRDDELRHRVELVGELALALRPSAGETLIGSQPNQQGVGLSRLVQLELIPVVSAVELEGPTRVLESRLAPRRLHDAVERYELRHHDPCCHRSISFTPTRRLATPTPPLLLFSCGPPSSVGLPPM